MVAGGHNAGHVGDALATGKKVVGMRKSRNCSGESIYGRLVVQREAVAHLKATFGLSERQAC